MKRTVLDRLVHDRTLQRPVALVTDLETGLQTLVYPDLVHGGFGLDTPVLDEARRLLAQDRSGQIETEGGSFLFVRSYRPAPRLIVVGAVHIAQALVPMARLAGYRVVVVDPRGTFASTERFPDTTILATWPDEALAGLALDAGTAVVTLSHDPKLDDPALTQALRSPAFYIGALGSRRTQAKRLERLQAQGFDPATLARVRGPVGLAIGAVTPAEIAIAILAEVTLARRGVPSPEPAGPSP